MNNKFLTQLKHSALAMDSFWALVGSVLGKGLSLLAGIAVARFLGKEMYGEYGIIKNTLINIAVFSTLGLGYTGTRYIARYVSNNSQEVWHIIKTIYKITCFSSSIIAVLVFIFAQPIAVFIKAPDMVWALRLTAFIIVLNAINTSQIGILSGFREFRIIARNNTYSGIATFLFSVIGAFFFALEGALVALLLSMVYNALINYYSIAKLKRGNLTQEDSQFITSNRELILFSLPIALQESMYTIVHFLGAFLMITYGGYGELGIISAAAQWSSVLLFIPGVLKNVMLAHFSSTNSPDMLRRRMMLINGLSTFLPWIVIALMSQLISSTYGRTFTNLHIVLSISCLAAVFSSISGVIVYELISRGKNWVMFGIRAIRDSSSLALSWYFLSHNNTIQPSIISVTIGTTMNFMFMLLLLMAINRFNVTEQNKKVK